MGNRASEHIRSNVVGYLALVCFAMSGVAQALPGANTVDSGDIKNNQVRSVDIMNGQVKGHDIANGAVSEKKLKVKPGSVTSVDSGTGLTGGPITSSGTLSLLESYRLPQLCGSGQVAKSNGSGLWTCANDIDTDTDTNSGGTVTSVDSGTGLTGGPFTSTGTLSLLQSFQLPQGCGSGQVAKSNGSTQWSCADDIDTDTNSGGTVTSVGSGTGLTGGPVTGTGSLALLQGFQLPQGCASGDLPRSNGSTAWSCSSTTDGPYWALAGNAGTTAGFDFLGTTDDEPLEFKVNNWTALRLEPNATSPNVIGGVADNSVSAGAFGAAIGGGGSTTFPNLITDEFGTIGGGEENQAGNDATFTDDRRYTTVGGGKSNLASGESSTIAGGFDNSATTDYAAVGGGTSNSASGTSVTVAGGNNNSATTFFGAVGGGSGNQATGGVATISGGQNNAAAGTGAAVPGGLANSAAGDTSVAAGNRAKVAAAHDGSFLFADGTASDFASAAANEFAVRATGGFRFRTNAALTNGCDLAPGGGTFVCTSDRASKTGYQRLDPGWVLDRLEGLPVTSWRYRDEAGAPRHVGPTAQAFANAFGLGADRRGIALVDANGIALAAVKGLDERLDALSGGGDAQGGGGWLPAPVLLAVALLAALLVAGVAGGALALRWRPAVTRPIPG